MLDRASWILRTGLLLSTFFSAAQAEAMRIRFADLDDYARDNGPRTQIIEREHVNPA